MVVQLSVRELEQLIDARLTALAKREPAPALLTIDQLAQALGRSRSMISRLRIDGMPVVWLGDSPRAELQLVLAWLRELARRRS